MRILGLLLKGAIFLAFCGFWSAVTLTFDVTWARNISRQTQVGHYATTDGWVVEARNVSNRTRRGTSTRAELSYAYTVNGRTYTGTRVRYGTESGERTARELGP